MISKLRKKFTFINLSLIALVFIVFFTTIILYFYRENRLTTEAVLHDAIVSVDELPSFHFGPLTENRPGMNIPIFIVMIQDDGSFMVTYTRPATYLADEFMIEAVKEVVQGDDITGVIHHLNLRFLVENGKIAFADMTFENTANHQIWRTVSFFGIGGLIVFFFISLYLARWALRPVEAAWKQQQQFLADASHELKTPLTVILANLSILKTNIGLTERQKWISNTNEEALRMKHLVEKLLFLAKNDSNEKERVHTTINLAELSWQTVLAFEAVAFEKGLELDTEIEDDVLIKGDEVAIKQLLGILIDNAIKYAAGIKPVLFTLKNGLYGPQLSIINDGPVIAKEEIPRLFDRFYRADKSRGSEKGYGLGLAIAKAIVDQHESKITVTSDEQSGTCFTIEFPH